MAEIILSPEYLVQLYDYNYWANRRLLTAAEALTPEQLFKDHAHSWGSVHGVLVHMMSAEWIWLRRWQGESPKSVLHPEDFSSLVMLGEHWQKVEAEMRAFVTAQSAGSLMREVTYTSTKGKTNTLRLWQLMVHVANHGTHHRGELAAMLALMDVPHLEEDWFLYFLIQSGQMAE